MAVPSYATDLTDIVTSFTTGWSLTSEGGGGQNALTAPDADDFIQGSNCASRNPFSSSIRGHIYDKVTAPTITADDAVLVWWKADVAQALDTLAGGGVHMSQGISPTARRLFYLAGKDTYAKGGWKCSPVDPAATADRTVGTPGAVANTDHFGMAWDVPASGPTKGFPFKIDMIRHGRSVDVTAGEIANPATWDTLTTYADDITRRWGLVQQALSSDGSVAGAEVQGIVNWGTAAASVYSRDSNRTITLLDTQGFTTTDFTQLVFANASTDLEWTNITVNSNDALNRGIITINNNAPVSFFGCSFTDIDTTADGGTNSVWDNSTWLKSNAVTSAGGSFLGANILESSVALNTSAFVYDINTNPSGVLDGMQFTMGALAHHAIEFGTTSPLTLDLNDIDFSGFGAANTANDSMLHIKRTAGTVTINLSGVTIDGGAGTVTYRSDGATVSLVASSQLTITNLDNPSEVRVYDAGTTTAVVGQEDVTTGTFSSSIDAATYPSVDISILSLTFQNYQILGVSMSSDVSIIATQQTDRQYENL